MNDVNINVNVNADTKTKRRKLEKDYKKFGFTSKDILRLTTIAENDLLVDTINKNIRILSNKLNIKDFKILLDDVNAILKNKLNEIKEKKEKNKIVKENQIENENNQNF
ncbi:hypothetical protein [Fusobacterium animalis]|uniref:hypothetical protein n=1 Tax=Fusobacterium animalis TaxID=76859 RepID=UPI0034DFBB83